ncbi:MAG: DUF4340 domain-containing protein, partial [Proteobacteria bacterium]
MKRAVWPYLLVATLSAGLALWVSLEPIDSRSEGKSWDGFSVESMADITFQTPLRKLSIHPTNRNYSWIEVAEKESTELFYESNQSPTIFLELAPLWSTKNLGPAKRLNLNDYGLTENSSSLRIQLKDGLTRDFIIGSKVYRSSEHYVLDKQRSEVFLLDGKLIQSMNSINPKNSLQTLRFLDPAQLKSIHLRMDRKDLYLSRAEASDFIIQWIDRLARLKIVKLLPYQNLPDSHLIKDNATNEIDDRWTLTFYRNKTIGYYLTTNANEPLIVIDEKYLEPLLKEIQSSDLFQP